MANDSIRKAARMAGVPFWKIAQHIGVSEPTLTRWLRTPLPEAKENAIREAIKELEKGE